LLPLPFTWEAVHHIVPRIRVVQERLERPFLIENISYYATMGPQELTEAQFLAEILERSDCGLLLDVNNIFVNAQNHGYDPGEFLNAIPLERVVQLHVAGHLRQKHLVVDTHAEPVCSEVWDLLAVVIQRTCAKGILLERDDNLPPIDSLLSELDQIRSICHSSGKSNGVSLPLGVHQK
jgi:uncharacterized protein (UPF0276 family)